MNRFIISILTFLLLYFSLSEVKAEGIGITEVKAVFSKNYTQQQKMEYVDIIKKRFISLSNNNVVISLNNDSLFIKVPIEIDSIVCVDILNMTGTLGISETYSATEITPILINADSILSKMANLLVSDSEKEHPLFSIFVPNIDSFGRIYAGNNLCGYAYAKDTTMINDYLRSSQIEKLFPKDMRFVWTKYANNRGYSNYNELYAIKYWASSKYAIDDSMIESVKFNMSYFAEVSVTLKKEYHKTWEELTSKNIGKPLSIIIDGNVQISPVVNQTITGGAFSISNYNNVYQAKALVAILKNEKFPTKFNVEVVEVRHIYPPMRSLMNLINKLK